MEYKYSGRLNRFRKTEKFQNFLASEFFLFIEDNRSSFKKATEISFNKAELRYLKQIYHKHFRVCFVENDPQNPTVEYAGNMPKNFRAKLNLALHRFMSDDVVLKARENFYRYGWCAYY